MSRIINVIKVKYTLIALRALTSLFFSVFHCSFMDNFLDTKIFIFIEGPLNIYEETQLKAAITWFEK